MARKICWQLTCPDLWPDPDEERVAGRTQIIDCGKRRAYRFLACSLRQWEAQCIARSHHHRYYKAAAEEGFSARFKASLSHMRVKIGAASSSSAPLAVISL